MYFTVPVIQGCRSRLEMEPEPYFLSGTDSYSYSRVKHDIFTGL